MKQKSKLNDLIRKNKTFALILAAAFLARLILFFQYHEIWWDSGVYYGMGKFLLSFGSAGLWEHIRPVLWPLILGMGWKAGFNIAVFGRILTVLLSLGSILLFYAIAKKIFGKQTALIGSIMFSFSAIFFYEGFHTYTEIPAVFFILLGVYLFIEKRFYFAGASFGLAFLAKFPTPLFFVAALIVLIYQKEIKNSFFLCIGFSTPVIPFLIANQLAYGSFLLPLLDAKSSISNVLGCNVLRYKPFYYYFYAILFDNPLNIFFLLGAFHFFRRYDPNKLLPMLCAAIPFAYFSQLHCRDYRYLVVFLPFVVMFSASGIQSLIKKKEYFIPALFAVLAVSAVFSLHFYAANEQSEDVAATGYFRFLEGKDAELEVWSSNPTISAYSDAKISKIYYPIYDEGVAVLFYDYLIKNSGRIGYVFMDNCGGGLICASGDTNCMEILDSTFAYLDENFELAYNQSWGICRYRIYQK